MQCRKKKWFFKTVFPTMAVLIPVIAFMQTEAVQAFYEKRELVPVGRTVGVSMDTKGLLVLGTGIVSGKENVIAQPCKGILKAGDLILEADGVELENKEAFLDAVRQSEGEKITLLLERKGKEKTVEVTPVFSAADHAYQIGAWIRDSIQGIGTVTYYDPASGTFGALGHGVYDVDTGELMQIREGKLTASALADIKKGEKGVPGELTGKVNVTEKVASIAQNTEVGIYGQAEDKVFNGEAFPLAAPQEIRKGEAFLLSDLEGEEVKPYALRIESIDREGGRKHKDMQIRITDERLLELTGGIVQGMSGSPIIQDGKLVGAVTYVLVNDPTKGYGIFIENMIQH